MQAVSRLFQSRKFLIALVDVVVCTSTYFVTKYVAPSIAEDVLYMVALTQPVVISVIAAIAVEDAAAKSSASHVGRFK